jgi:ATP-binding cassette, subfamily B, bacterial
VVTKLWKLLSPFHRAFGWFVILLLVYEGLQVAESYLISMVVQMHGSGVRLTVWMILLGGLFVYDEVFMRLDNALDWHVVTKHSYPLYRFLKTSAIAKFLGMDIPWHLQHNSGKLIGKVSNGVWKVIEVADAMSWEFVPTLIQTLLSLIPILIFSPGVAMVSGVSFLIFLMLTVKGNKERKPIRIKRHDWYEEEWHRAVEDVQAVETGVMFNQTDRILSEHDSIHQNIVDLGKEEARIGIYKYNRLRIRVLSFSRRMILVLWVYQLYSGTLDVAGLIFVSILTEKLFHSFWRFARLFDRATEASEGIERLINLMEEQTRVLSGGANPKVKSKVGIEMSNVCFSYNGEYNAQIGALHDLSISIKPGEIVALVGPSGSGKTTIRKLITGLNQIQSGEITVGDVKVEKWDPEALRKLYSYVPQGDDVHIFARSIKDNILYPRPNATFEEVVTASKLAGIHEFIVGLPDGYETTVGERGKRLSGGQKQRVALARAILADRPILILDEATSAVDAITEEAIQRAMEEILSGKTAIIIAHRLSTIWGIANKIVVLESGRKIEEGSHEELIQAKGLYAKMVVLQTAE